MLQRKYQQTTGKEEENLINLIWMLEVPKSLGMRTPSRDGPIAVRKLGAFTSTDMRSESGFSLRHLTMSWWFFIMFVGTVQLRLLATLTA